MFGRSEASAELVPDPKALLMPAWLWRHLLADTEHGMSYYNSGAEQGGAARQLVRVREETFKFITAAWPGLSKANPHPQPLKSQSDPVKK